MFVASYRNTMANARPVEAPKPRREKLIETARRWERMRREEQARKEVEADWRIRLMKAVTINPPRTRTAAEIIDYVAWWHGLTRLQLLSRECQKAWAPARFDAIAAIHMSCPDLSLGQIAKAVKRDHASVKNALRQRGLR